MGSFRLLVDQGAYTFRNLGDIAMLQVAVQRLRALWPAAQMLVVTDRPDRLRRYCPGPTPVSPQGCVSPALARLSPRLDDWVMRKAPVAAAASLRLQARLAHRRIASGRTLRGPIRAVGPAVRVADAIVCCGGGFVNDSFSFGAVAARLAAAGQAGKATAMVGQGIGPIAVPEHHDAARAMLRSVDLILLREGRTGLPLLASMGVPSGRVAVTGDDTVEMAYRLRPEQPGAGLGFNLRRSYYSGLDEATALCAARVAASFAGSQGAPLVPVPISLNRGEGDLTTFEGLLAGFGGTIERVRRVEVPEDAIAQASRCRTVIAGSYHAAVFALAQGVPVVSVMACPYYEAKLLGLAELFGEGCQVVDARAPGFEDRLRESLRRSWAFCADVRPQLLERAAQQVEAGHAGYARLRALIDERRAGAPQTVP